MAQNKKRSSRKRTPPPPNPAEQMLAALVRPGPIGAALVLLAVFTLLSLLADSRGALTGAWVEWLQSAFGLGAWGFPVVTGALGLWLVIHAIDKVPDLPWQQPVGATLLFLALITGAELLHAGDGLGGGAVGFQVANVLRGALSLWGAWAMVTFMAVAAVIIIGDRWLMDAMQDLRVWLVEARDRRAMMPPAVQPEFPMPSGELPWWKRTWEQLRGLPEPRRPSLPIDTRMVPADPARRPALTEARAAPVPATLATPPSQSVPAAGAARPGEGEVLMPRIVGGAQEWRLPRLDDMLRDWERSVDTDDQIRKQGRLIQETLGLFGVPADFEGAYKGPAVTQYLIKPGYLERNIKGERKREKVKVAKIAALANDLALALAASSVRIEAPIPGTGYVGVEVPNSESNVVGLKELMESEAFTERKGRLRIALGEDVKGQPIVTDLARMPHLLIAGATGSGKSVCINSIIICLLLTHTPDSLRLLMVDPKMVELSIYNGVPHLLSPVVTEIDKAAGVLFWAVKEMERRYQLLNKASARDLDRYNDFLVKRGEKKLPHIVVIVDEMADLMMAAPEEVEKHICRLAQMARAVGIHLIIATQRPSVDVITGLIKANFPARIAFAVTSQIDSRVILDIPGAERLLGRGDMLFMAPDAGKLERLQGAFLSDDEINRVVRYWKGVRVYTETTPLPGTDLPAAGGGTPTGTSTGGAAAPEQIPYREELPRRSAATGGDMPRLTPEQAPTPGRTGSLPPPAPPAETPPAAGAPSAAPATQPPLFEQIEAMRAAEGRDVLFEEAVRVVRQAGRGSVSLLQRKLRIGYGRASRIVEQLEEAGYLGPDQGGSGGREYTGPDARQPGPDMLQPRIIGASEDDEGDSATPNFWIS